MRTEGDSKNMKRANMKLRVAYILGFIMLFLNTAQSVCAELSLMNKVRIEQAIHRCETFDNELKYLDYWQDTITDENRETACLAEQFARQVAENGERWIQSKGDIFIVSCQKMNKGEQSKYYRCLRKGVDKILKQVTSPCNNLGAARVWDAEMCTRLVSYIFIIQFEEKIEKHKPILQKLLAIEFLKKLFQPIPAIILLVAYVLNIVLFADPGHWARIPRFGFSIGVLILLASYLEQGTYRFIASGVAIIIVTIAFIISTTHALIRLKRK